MKIGRLVLLSAATAVLFSVAAWAGLESVPTLGGGQVKVTACGMRSISTRQEVTGEVICAACYLIDAKTGDKQAASGKKCIGKGLPAAILTDEKEMVLVVADKHGSAAMKLAPFAGKRVKISGMLSVLGPYKIIAMEKMVLLPFAAPVSTTSSQ